MAGCLLAALTYFPLFRAITHYANPALEAAQASAPVDGRRRSGTTARSQFDPVGTAKFTQPCDVAKAALASGRCRTPTRPAPAGTTAQVHDRRPRRHERRRRRTVADAKAQGAAFDKALGAALTPPAIRRKADPAQINQPMVDRACCGSS